MKGIQGFEPSFAPGFQVPKYRSRDGSVGNGRYGGGSRLVVEGLELVETEER